MRAIALLLDGSMTAEPVLPCSHHFSPATGGELISHVDHLL